MGDIGVIPELSPSFPRYADYAPQVPIWCVTPGEGRLIHRFFDTSPFSPSGRYLALTRLPVEDRLPQPGQAAQVVLVDLETGEEAVVADTRGWDTQLGAQAQWGAKDSQLFFNDLDIDSWRPFGIRLDPITGATKQLDGPVYMVSRDGRWALSPCLLRTGATQPGYGVLAPPEAMPVNLGAPEDDGVFITDTQSGKCRLLISLAEVVDRTQPLSPTKCREGAFYAAHVKWNPQASRIMLVLRWLPPPGDGRMERMLVTMAADGSDVRIAVPAEMWARGGHHPNWCPDGEAVMMNLNLHGEGMRFVRARYDGTELAVMSERVAGSGHPTLHPDGRHVLTDAYPDEPVAPGDGTVPLRLIDLQTETERALARVKVVPPFEGAKRELRVDPHPAWDYGFRRVAFNACPDGTRRVYVADLSGLVVSPRSIR